METQPLCIEGIPALLWGPPSQHVYIAVHGDKADKRDAAIAAFAQEAVEAGYQVLSFDLPGHGERAGDGDPCKPPACVRDLGCIYRYAAARYSRVCLFACSLGAYFSLLAYPGAALNQCLFLSPVVDMRRMIENMMAWFGVSEQVLQEQGEVETPIGQTLYWDYYQYVCRHPVTGWGHPTAVLYGEKDETVERDTVEAFCRRFGAVLEIVPEGKHYFHTDRQLACLRGWAARFLGGGRQ